MRRPLLCALFRYTRSWEEAKELVQEVGTRLVATCETRGAFKCEQAYVWTVAHSVGADWCRARKRIVPTVPIEDTSVENSLVHSINSQDRIAYLQELTSLLETLTPQQRRAVELHYLGYSYAEIASDLQRSVETAKSHLKEARRWICERFPQGDPNDD